VKQLRALREHQGPREKKLRLSDVKEMSLEMKRLSRPVWITECYTRWRLSQLQQPAASRLDVNTENVETFEKHVQGPSPAARLRSSACHDPDKRIDNFAPSQFIADGAGARPRHPINGHRPGCGQPVTYSRLNSPQRRN
jgi:hypothetical protein